MANPHPPFDRTATVPTGYVTAQELASEYNRSEACVRFRMRYDHVPTLRLERRNAAGQRIGGHKLLVYRAAAAHAALTRPMQRMANGSSPGYIGQLAIAYGLTRRQVRDILDAAGVEPQQRVCPCCGKSTLFYRQRPAAIAALNTWQRRHGTRTENP